MSEAAKAAEDSRVSRKRRAGPNAGIRTLYGLVYCSQQSTAEDEVKWDSSRAEGVVVEEENEAVEDFVGEVAQKFFGANR